MDADEKNLLILNEVRKMNRLQREDNTSIGEMSDQITYYLDLLTLPSLITRIPIKVL